MNICKTCIPCLVDCADKAGNSKLISLEACGLKYCMDAEEIKEIEEI